MHILRPDQTRSVPYLRDIWGVSGGCLEEVLGMSGAIHPAYARLPKASVKKQALDHPPHFNCQILFLYSFLFPYRQVDKLFQMDHGAISPSLTNTTTSHSNLAATFPKTTLFLLSKNRLSIPFVSAATFWEILLITPAPQPTPVPPLLETTHMISSPLFFSTSFWHNFLCEDFWACLCEPLKVS